MSHTFFAPAPRGIAPLLADELRTLGVDGVDESRAGVGFQGPLSSGYRVCLWSRLASRVLLVIERVPAPDADTLYASVRQLPWAEHMAPTGTLAVQFNGMSPEIRNTHFGALRVKDAVVDAFRETTGERPSIDLERPDLRLNAHLHAGSAVISVDLSGQGLHRRGYRVAPVAAPLKENLAAAVLQRAGWPAMAASGEPLVDPMCGSGTLLIEAAWMATDRAPALHRDDLGLLRWRGHDADLWSQLLDEARERAAAGRRRRPSLCGFDVDPGAVKAARANLKGAGVEGVRVERRDIGDDPGPVGGPGLLVTNPPYGQRLGEEASVRSLYTDLAARLRASYGGWQVAVLSGNPEWAPSLGLSTSAADMLYNGALECQLLRGHVPVGSVAGVDSAGSEMLANRLRKNRKSLGRWARKAQVTCYRLYDADMPEYNLAVDLYQSGRLRVHVQEYRAPHSVDPARAAGRLQEALATIANVLEIPRGQLYFKVREKKRGADQYQRLGTDGAYHEVREGPVTLLVNFTDYLDTGLFLDHRPTRALIGELAAGRRFLNLFAYTGTASVHAAAGGATATTTLDMSRPYLDWARRNLERNGFRPPQHELVQADCVEWLAQRRRERFGLIFLDPPTFSNSKRMAETLDLQRDHVDLIRRAAGLLSKGGVLLFSTNFRQFKLDGEALAGLRCEDISKQTLPRDFERNPRVHQCYRITVAGGA